MEYLMVSKHCSNLATWPHHDANFQWHYGHHEWQCSLQGIMIVVYR